MYRFYAVLLLALSLAACGGGGTTTGGTGGGGTGVTNIAPVVANPNTDQAGQVGFAFNYDASQAGTVCTDADGDAITYTVSYNPGAAGLVDNAGVISGTPNAKSEITAAITCNDGKGGSASDIFIISVTIDQTAVQTVFNGKIDLENLDGFSGQAVPTYITKLNEGGNPITNAGATLGRVLFYDTALSITNTFSCASCHEQSLGFSDPGVLSDGVDGGVTGRHSMRLVNTQFADEGKFFWDERAATHEIQETQPIKDDNELGYSGNGGRPTFADLVVKLEALEYYEELFRFAFLDPEITEEKIQLALAQFTKSIHSFDSRYDTGRAQVNSDRDNFPNYTAQENAGKALFMNPPPQGGVRCFICHRPPEFDITPNSGTNGVVRVANSAEFDFTNTRSPSLRDVVDPNGVSNGPFMHDGSLPTLLDVVNHYNNIQDPTGGNPQFMSTLDMRLRPMGNILQLNLSQAEKDQLVAFMETLTGQNLYVDPKWSDPFSP